MHFNFIALLPIVAVVLCALIAWRVTPRTAWKRLNESPATPLDDFATNIAKRVRRDSSYTPYR